MARRGHTTRKTSQGRAIVRNRRARYEYTVLETFDAGIQLLGTEVKSLRQGEVSLGDGHARFFDGELYLVNVHINPYRLGTHENHEPTRKRKLLLRRRELSKLSRQLQERGFALVPLSLYFNERGLCKVELGVCKGRRARDKRQAIAERENKRNLARAQKHGDD